MARIGPTTAWTDSETFPHVGVPLARALGVPAAPGGSAQPGRPAQAGAGYLVSVVGAGGKTTIAHALADELAAAGRRVAITTTTQMFVEPGLRTDIPQALAALDALPNGGVVLAGVPGASGKFGGFGPDGLAALRRACDVLIVEADGSKRLPVKVPADHEPVVPPDTDLLLVVAGLSALGRALEEVCFRCELVPDVLGEDVDARRPLGEALAARLLTAGYLHQDRLRPWLPQRTAVVLHQADDLHRWRAGRVLAADLPAVRTVLTTAVPAAGVDVRATVTAPGAG